MEKYSKHLETLVSERTQDLMHEKQKTDRLLYSKLCCKNIAYSSQYSSQITVYLQTETLQ